VAEPFPTSLHAALAALAEWIATERIPATIIGGIAVSVLGRPRLTRDIDALAIVSEEQWGGLVESAARFGIIPRLEEAVRFAQRSRVLLLRHAPSAIDLDITFGGLPFEQSVVEKSSVHDVGGLQVRLPRVEDLLVMKAVARRPKDLEDIRGLLAANPDVNVSGARRWIGEFATAMSMPDILEEFDRLVAQQTSG